VNSEVIMVPEGSGPDVDAIEEVPSEAGEVPSEAAAAGEAAIQEEISGGAGGDSSEDADLYMEGLDILYTGSSASAEAVSGGKVRRKRGTKKSTKLKKKTIKKGKGKRKGKKTKRVKKNRRTVKKL
jgi:hypothetical protein